MTRDSMQAMQFYDELAADYHLLFEDWDASVQRQGSALGRLLESLRILPGAKVHDAACGIGTQTLGLLRAGYRVSASDVSSAAVERLERELIARGLSTQAFVDDMTALNEVPDQSVQCVMACDNSVPHLLSDRDILQAFTAFHRCLMPGGAVVLSVRDYEKIPRTTPAVHPYGVRSVADGRIVALQVWDWDENHYDLRMIFVHEHADGRCTSRVLRTRYYAVTVTRLSSLLAQAGFHDVVRHDAVLYQPVLTALR
jgi:SAM-dependent methyltransferase